MLLAKWSPYRLDGETSPISMDSQSCTESLNFLFERGIARTRPHMRRRSITELVAANYKVDFAKSFLLNQGNRYSLYITDGGAMYRFAATDSATSHAAAEITGAGTSFGDRLFHNIAVWAGIVLVGNNTGGILQHTPISTTTYTVISDAKYRYITTSFNRAVAAYDITSGANNPRSIGWSTTTDVSDWTSAGSGSTELTDIPDDITGLVNINNVIVVARTYGWTLGRVTGSNTTGPFRWEMMVREGAGCAWPSTLAHYNNMIFCVGHDNIYSFDLSKGPQPIGGPIRRELLHTISSGARYRGIITRGDLRWNGDVVSATVVPTDNNASPIPRLRYHLVPIVNTEGASHYSYDVQEQTWSAHRYNTSIRDAFEYVLWPQRQPVFSFTAIDDNQQTTSGGVAFPTMYQWFDGQTRSGNRELLAFDDLVDQGAVLHSPVFLLNGSAERDYDIKELYVTWALEGDEMESTLVGGLGTTPSETFTDTPPVDLIVTSQQNHKETGQTMKLDLAGKINYRRHEWNRTKFPMRLNGNLLQLKLRIPTGVKIAIKQIEVHGEDSAQSRAA